MGKSESRGESVLAVEMWPISRPKPYANNPRIIPSSAVEKVAASIEEFGWRQPIVVDANDEIIVGHTRLKAAKFLGLKKVPVHVADMTEAQVRAYRLADNRVGEDSHWELEMLRSEFEALGEIQIEPISMGFETTDLLRMNMPDAPFDAESEWKGMPEFDQQDHMSKTKLIVHFATDEDRAAFAKLVGQDFSEKCKSIWYPEAEIGRTAGKRYE